MRFKSDVDLDVHLRAAIGLARWGAYAFLGMAGIVTATVTIAGLFGPPMPAEELARVGGVFFYLFISLIGMFLIFGFFGSAVLHYLIGENELREAGR